MLSGLNEMFLPEISATAKKELHKIHVGPESCIGKRKSNIFFLNVRNQALKKVRKVEEHKIWVRGRLDPFLDFVSTIVL